MRMHKSFISFLCLVALMIVFVVATGATKDFRADFSNLRASNTTVGNLTFSAANDTITGIWTGQVSLGSSETTGTVTLAGVTATDLVIASISSGNSSNRTLLKASPGTNKVDVTLSGTPGATTKVDVVVFR